MSTDGMKPPSFTPTGAGPHRTSVRTQDRRPETAAGTTTTTTTGTTVGEEHEEQVRGARPSPMVPGARPDALRRDEPGPRPTPERSTGEQAVDAGTETPRRPGPAARPGRPAEARPVEERPAPAQVGPRRVRLALARIDPWSVMKLAFLLSFAVGIMIVVAAAVVWTTLDSMGVFVSINTTIAEITGSETFFNLLEYVAFDRIMALATIIAIVDVVLLTALATLFAFLYNIVAALVGGIHVTLTDD